MPINIEAGEVLCHCGRAILPHVNASGNCPGDEFRTWGYHTTGSCDVSSRQGEPDLEPATPDDRRSFMWHWGLRLIDASGGRLTVSGDVPQVWNDEQGNAFGNCMPDWLYHAMAQMRNEAPAYHAAWFQEHREAQRRRVAAQQNLEHREAQRRREESMTTQDCDTMAEVLRRAKPSPEGGTVGENLLWRKLVNDLATLAGQRCPSYDLNRFYERVGEQRPEDDDEW